MKKQQIYKNVDKAVDEWCAEMGWNPRDWDIIDLKSSIKHAIDKKEKK